MRRLNSISITLILLGIISVSMAGLPNKKEVLVDQKLENDSFSLYRDLQIYVSTGETVQIFIKGINSVPVNVTILGDNINEKHSGRNLDIKFTKTFTERSMIITIGIESEVPTSVSVYAFVEGGDIQTILYMMGLILMLLVSVSELIIRRVHPPYIEDESRSISIVGLFIPLVLVGDNFLNNSGLILKFQFLCGLPCTTPYSTSLLIEALFKFVLRKYTQILLFTLLGLSVVRSFSKRRISVYKTLPINTVKQYFARVVIWSSVVLSILTLIFFSDLFERRSQFEGYDTFYLIYLYAFSIVLIVSINMVLLHINVLDTFQDTKLAVFIVPTLMLLSVQEIIPSIPMFEGFHHMNWRDESHPSEMIIIVRQLIYTILLLIYGVVNRKRNGYRAGN